MIGVSLACFSYALGSVYALLGADGDARAGAVRINFQIDFQSNSGRIRTIQLHGGCAC